MEYYTHSSESVKSVDLLHEAISRRWSGASHSRLATTETYPRPVAHHWRGRDHHETWREARI